MPQFLNQHLRFPEVERIKPFREPVASVQLDPTVHVDRLASDILCCRQIDCELPDIIGCLRTAQRDHAFDVPLPGVLFGFVGSL